MNKKIYTAGPISGLTYAEGALGWRETIKGLLPEFDLFSPMRAKSFLASEGVLQGAYEGNPMSSTNGILGRDRNDVFTCDLMIACFLDDEDNVSLGTAMEFGWADAWRKPVIMVAAEGNVHRNHPMLRGASVYVVDTLEEAAILAKHLLLPEAVPVEGVKRLWDSLPGVKSLRLTMIGVSDSTGPNPPILNYDDLNAEVVVDIIDHNTGEVVYSFGSMTLENGGQFLTIKLDAEVELEEEVELDPKYGKLNNFASLRKDSKYLAPTMPEVEEEV